MDTESGRPEAGSGPFSTVPIVARQLVVPQGFTLSIAGTLAILLERHPRPSAVVIWLFVVGAAAGFCLVVQMSGAHRHDAPVWTAVGAQLFNVVPVVVVPVVALAVAWMPSPHLAYPVAGLAISCVYVLAVTFLFHSFTGPARR